MPTQRSTLAFAWTSLIATLAVFLLAVTGSVVRAAAAGLSCPDWPTCQGFWLPALVDPTVTIAVLHRALTVVAGLLITVVAVTAWLRHRHDPWLVLPSISTVVLLLFQVILGGVAVVFELQPAIITAHLAAALLLLGTLVTVTAAAFARAWPALEPTRAPGDLSRVTLGLAIAVFGLLLTGAAAAGARAPWACLGVADCQSAVTGLAGDGIRGLYLLFSTAAVILLAGCFGRAWRLRQRLPSVYLASLFTLLLGLAQTLLTILTIVPALVWPEARVLHLTVGIAFWAATALLLSLVAFAQSMPRATGAAPGGLAATHQAAGEGRPTIGQLLRAYIALMKPRIIVLLLITTLAAMVLAQRGFPPLALVLVTMLGGTLAAGGANAINQYLDRDIDELMKRTRQRPLPQHRVPPRRALIFGVILGALSFVVLTLFANLLAAALAIVGLLFYVFVYTVMLKRTTPQNIVIGGAAGAIPPLVGWAAVSNEISLPALYLFAIIFFWTPPHFWALSLLLKADYAAARVPMLPVIAGEAETKRQIVLYSVLLVAVTLLLFGGRMMGLWYLASALVLGGILIALAIQLTRGAERLWARRLFFFSNAYLALLFIAMIVDRVVLNAAPATPEVVRLFP